MIYTKIKKIMKTKKWFVLWFTGLSWAGKSTIADWLYKKLNNEWYLNIERLDWDFIRKTITWHLWFTKKDRKINMEIIGYISKLLSRNWVWVIASFISPYEYDRIMIKNQVINYIEIFVNTSIYVCEKRDVKWLYKKAREWIIKNFTGISDTYEKPKNPDIEIKTESLKIEDSINLIYSYLKNNNFI